MNDNLKKFKDDYAKALKKIEEANRNIRYRYIQGPKGDKGEKGDASSITFTVGNTLTVEPTENAEVTNVGTNSEVILEFKIPKGEKGPQGEKGNIGPIGPKGEQGEQGIAGISEKITIENTETLEPTEEANVIDTFNDNTHHLTFYIPKGEKGATGAGAGATAYNAILFVNYADATDVRALTIKEKTFIPDPTSIFKIPSTINIDINTTGIYEITLCGKISGVTSDNGATFFLWNTVTGTVINNLNFGLVEGATPEMTFSGTTITQIFAPATLQVKTTISNDPNGANIKFTDINLVIKRFNS